MYEDLLDQFNEEREVTYRGEKYLVRDNGAICRLSRHDKRKRPLDYMWTFGNPCNWNGYMKISKEPVHRIVATAFHGEQPSDQHIVDHIDTNRRNNRAENLRWLTRLENILQNPFTRRKIELEYGSIDNFFKNPRDYEHIDQRNSYLWMRPVSKEEAYASRERLTKWAASKRKPSGVIPGEWVFSSRQNHQTTTHKLIKQSITPRAIQKNWHSPSKFPLCPNQPGEKLLSDYLSNLKKGRTFSRSKFAESIVYEANVREVDSSISVICELESFKPWAVARITVEIGKFCHENCGSFFSIEGATKQHYKNLGLAWDDTIYCFDDYC